MSHLLILGFGYTAQRFLSAHGHAFASVQASVRDPAKAAQVADAGAEPLWLGREPAAFGRAVRAADGILVTAGPDQRGDPFVHRVAEALEGSARQPSIVYLSTIGVYGDHGGAWVDENVSAAPSNARGRARVDAEAAWIAMGETTGAPVAILRLPGIYGPGRSAYDALREGTARRIVKPGQVFNRAHVDDIAAAVAACLAHRARGIFNIADDEPAPPQDVMAEAARLLGVPPPPEIAFAEAQMTEMARSFYGDCKRVSNRKAKAALAWQPQYSTYREGLAAILAEETAAPKA